MYFSSKLALYCFVQMFITMSADILSDMFYNDHYKKINAQSPACKQLYIYFLFLRGSFQLILAVGELFHL